MSGQVLVAEVGQQPGHFQHGTLAVLDVMHLLEQVTLALAGQFPGSSAPGCCHPHRDRRRTPRLSPGPRRHRQRHGQDRSDPGSTADSREVCSSANQLRLRVKDSGLRLLLHHPLNGCLVVFGTAVGAQAAGRHGVESVGHMLDQGRHALGQPRLPGGMVALSAPSAAGRRDTRHRSG